MKLPLDKEFAAWYDVQVASTHTHNERYTHMFAITMVNDTFAHTFYERSGVIARRMIKYLSDEGWRVEVSFVK